MESTAERQETMYAEETEICCICGLPRRSDMERTRGRFDWVRIVAGLWLVDGFIAAVFGHGSIYWMMRRLPGPFKDAAATMLRVPEPLLRLYGFGTAVAATWMWLTGGRMSMNGDQY